MKKIFIITCLLSIMSCSKESKVEPTEQDTLIQNKDVIAQTFAKILAVSTSDVEVKNFLKEQSLKQFDGRLQFFDS